MTEIVDLNARRPPVVYTVTIVHHYDDTLEFRVEDVADDERSREAVMSAFRRISGADEEIEKLQTDLRHAINCDNEYVKEMDRQNAALREEIARLREQIRLMTYDMPAGDARRKLAEQHAEIERLKMLLDPLPAAAGCQPANAGK